MEENNIIMSIISGGLLGMLGQGVRVAVGLKKLNDATKNPLVPETPADKFSASRLLISIFIGFVAGAIAMLIKRSSGEESFLDESGGLPTESIVTIIAIGYSGADFIEGVFNTYANKFSPGTSTLGNTTTSLNTNNGATEQPATVHDEANFANIPAAG